MSKIKSLRSSESKEQILDAAGALIADRGFSAITLQEILDAAKVTKGKFFHYFKTKEDLFLELLRSMMSRRSFPVFSELLEGTTVKSPLDRLIIVIDSMIEWHRTGLPEIMRLCLFATVFFPLNELKPISERLNANSRTIEMLISACQDEELLPRSLNPKVLSLIFPSAAVGGNTVGFFSGDNRHTVKNL